MVNAAAATTPLLAYASADPAALRLGERLLWSGGTLTRRRWWHPRVDPPAFRITNRRAFCATRRPLAAYHQAPIPLPLLTGGSVHVPRRGPATIDVGLRLTGLVDWPVAVRHLAAIPRPPRRRRRGGSTPTPMTTHAPAADVPPDLAPVDLALLPDERVLWSGRPTPADALAWPTVRPKLVVLGSMLIPAAILAACLAIQPVTAAQVVFGLLAAVWLLIAGYSMTIAPLRRRWQLRRSRYVLTTRRAFAVAPDRGGQRVTFVFLDALPPAFARHHWPDAFGDVAVAHPVTFERVPDPAAVHATLVDAVLAARRDLPDLGWSASLDPPPDPDA